MPSRRTRKEKQFQSIPLEYYATKDYAGKVEVALFLGAHEKLEEARNDFRIQYVYGPFSATTRAFAQKRAEYEFARERYKRKKS